MRIIKFSIVNYNRVNSRARISDYLHSRTFYIINTRNFSIPTSSNSLSQTYLLDIRLDKRSYPLYPLGLQSFGRLGYK